MESSCAREKTPVEGNDHYLEAKMRFNDQYDNGNEELDEEQIARKAREQASLD